MKIQKTREQGAAMIEYALLLVLVLLIGMAGLQNLGNVTSSELKKIAEVIDGNGPDGGPTPAAGGGEGPADPGGDPNGGGNCPNPPCPTPTPG